MNFLYLTAVPSLNAAGFDNGVHLAGDKKEIWWGSAAFFIVLALILWKVLPSIKAGMAARTERIAAELDGAKAERAAAEKALTASTSDLPDVGREETRIRVEAEQTAAKLKEDLVAKAHAEADGVRERGKADVANRRRQAQADLSAEISEATRRATEDVVRGGLDSSSHGDLIDSYINQVGQMS